MLDNCNRTHIQAQTPVDYQRFGNLNSQNIILLLHGYAQNTWEITQSFKSIIDNKDLDCQWIIPNGIFPMPKVRANEVIYRFAWYFYNQFEQKYFIDFTYPTHVLQGLIASLFSEEYKLTVIGYSQGGYLAPFVAQSMNNVKNVIAINSNFRFDMMDRDKFHFNLHHIHGDKDVIVDYKNACHSLEKLKEMGLKTNHLTIPGEGHELSASYMQKVLDIITNIL